jgi:hypothetical protein
LQNVLAGRSALIAAANVCWLRCGRLYIRREKSSRHIGIIYHLPVLIAAFAAWVLGAIRHSQYPFRAAWIQAHRLSWLEVHQLVWTFAPHFLGVALLFAYGVAWLLAWSTRKGVIIGVSEAVGLWIFKVSRPTCSVSSLRTRFSQASQRAL